MYTWYTNVLNSHAPTLGDTLADSRTLCFGCCFTNLGLTLSLRNLCLSWGFGLGVVASVGYFGNVAGPPVIGALAASAGLLNALWLLVALFLAAFVVAGSLRRPGVPAPSTEGAG